MNNRKNAQPLNDFRDLLTRIAFKISRINQCVKSGGDVNMQRAARMLEENDKLLRQAAILIEYMKSKSTNTKLIQNAIGILAKRSREQDMSRIKVLGKMKVSQEDPLLGELSKAKVPDTNPKIGALVRKAYQDMIKEQPTSQEDRAKIIAKYQNDLTINEKLAFSKEFRAMAADYEKKVLAPHKESIERNAGKSKFQLLKELDNVKVPVDDPRITLSKEELLAVANRSKKELIDILENTNVPTDAPASPRSGSGHR